MLQKTAIKNLLPLALIIIAIGFSSCEKEEPATAIIIVKDVLGDPVKKALVEIYPDSSVTVDINRESLEEMTQSGETDANGRKEFQFEYEAILRVKVTKYSGNDTLRGNNVIRLRKEKTETKIIEVY